MKLAWFKINSAWQPLTFRGVAAFATAPLKRLLWVQFIVALVIACTVAWFFNDAWFPTMQEAIVQMPERGRIVSGKLDWTNEPSRLLAEGRFIAFTVDLDHTTELRVPAHIQIELGRNDVRFISLFGYMDQAYPVQYTSMDFNRLALEPWLGAWRLPILWVGSVTVFAGLMLAWWILASIYFLPVWLIGFFSNRRLSPVGSWKLAGAALMPGALLMMVGIGAYGFDLLDPVQLIAVQVAHGLTGLVYCCASVSFLPKLSTEVAAEKNPFQTGEGKKSMEGPEARPENPFKSSSK